MLGLSALLIRLLRLSEHFIRDDCGPSFVLLRIPKQLVGQCRYGLGGRHLAIPLCFPLEIGRHNRGPSPPGPAGQHTFGLTDSRSHKLVAAVGELLIAGVARRITPQPCASAADLLARRQPVAREEHLRVVARRAIEAWVVGAAARAPKAHVQHVGAVSRSDVRAVGLGQHGALVAAAAFDRQHAAFSRDLRERHRAARWRDVRHRVWGAGAFGASRVVVSGHGRECSAGRLCVDVAPVRAANPPAAVLLDVTRT